jgi:hypothetical protein
MAIANQSLPASQSPKKNMESKLATGGLSERIKSDNRGPIKRNALNKHRSVTKKPTKPDTPKTHQVSAEASVGRGRECASCP